MRNAKTTLYAAALLVCGVGCATSGPDEKGTGQLFVHVVDKPVGDVISLNVVIKKIDIRPCQGAWQTYDTPDAAFDLLSLQDGNFFELLSQLPLAADDYCETRLILSEEASAVLSDNSVVPVQVASGASSGVKVKAQGKGPGGFTIAPGQVTLVTVDFDASESLHAAGSKYVLDPVIFVKSVHTFPAPPSDSTATIVTEFGGAVEGDGFRLSFPSGSVSTPTLVWCKPVPGGIECGPNGTTFDVPINVAIQADISGLTLGDDQTVVIDHDGELRYTVVDMTTGWLYSRIEHFTGIKQFLLNQIDQKFGYYYNAIDVAQIGSAGDMKAETVTQGGYHHYKFKKMAGWRQVFCVEVEYGEVDLLTSWVNGVTLLTNGATLPGGGPHFVDLAGKDHACVALDISQSGDLYVGVRGVVASKFKPRLFSTDQKRHPTWLEGKLVWPLSVDGWETYRKFGPFNSPWGNGCEDPFFFKDGDFDNYLHNAVDIAQLGVQPAPVVAACPGTISKRGNAGTPWGEYLVLDCSISDSNGVSHGIQVAYVHLQNRQVDQGDQVSAGQHIGDIFAMTYKGEVPHLHFALCIGACNKPYSPTHWDVFDKTVREESAGYFINPSCRDNKILYGGALPAHCLTPNYAFGAMCPP